MGIDNLITLPEEKEEKSLTDKFNTRLMCSLCNKHAIIINKEEKSFDISENNLSKAINVDFQDALSNIKNDGIGFVGYNFIISKLTEKDIYTEKLYRCFGIFGFGISKTTGKNISFLGHQAPSTIIHSQFIEALISTIQELKNKSEKESIEIYLLGGNTFGYIGERLIYGEEYKDFISGISDILLKEFNIKLSILGGPTNDDFIRGTGKDIFIGTEEKRLKYYKSFLKNEENIDFKALEVGEVLKGLK